MIHIHFVVLFVILFWVAIASGFLGAWVIDRRAGREIDRLDRELGIRAAQHSDWLRWIEMRREQAHDLGEDAKALGNEDLATASKAEATAYAAVLIRIQGYL